MCGVVPGHHEALFKTGKLWLGLHAGGMLGPDSQMSQGNISLKGCLHRANSPHILPSGGPSLWEAA